MKAHVIENNVIVNTIIVDSLDFMPGLVSAEDGGNIGDEYRDGQFIAKPIDTEDLINTIRRTRNGLLSQSDWTQVLDAPVDRAAWASYRQALRDLPQQAGFPHIIDWPVAPNGSANF
jgi:hypothetical protein